MSDKSGPAFPIPAVEGCHKQELGLTKREEFAGRVMQGVYANEGFLLEITAGVENREAALNAIAVTSVAQADALLAALKEDDQ